MANPAAGDFGIIVKDYWTTVGLFGLFFAATTGSAVQPFIGAVKDKDWILVCVYLSYVVGLLLYAKYTIPRNIHGKALEKNVFSGIGSVGKTNFIPREGEVNEIIEALTSADPRPVFIVGASGAGKSIIVSESVTNRMRDHFGYTVCNISEYDAGNDSIKSTVRECLRDCGVAAKPDLLFDEANLEQIGEPKKILLVFDQFEQFLEHSTKKRDPGGEARRWFGKLVNYASQDVSFRILIVVRKEWYYDLRFLQEHVPPPFNTCHVSGLNTKTNTAGFGAIFTNLSKVTVHTDTADYIINLLTSNDEIMLMEYQIVGLLIENEGKARDGLTIKEFQEEYGSMEKVIEKYFLLYLDISPNRELALKVLFAMSQQRRLKKQCRSDQIAAMVHEKTEDVVECLAFLKKYGLVRKAPLQYELVHDYLADRYYDISGQELDPVDRDNILFFSEEFAKRDGLELTGSKKIGWPTKAAAGYLAFILFWRLLDPGGLLARTSGAITGGTPLWDLMFAPVFAAHVLWSSYIVELYHKLFVATDRTLKDRVLSRAVLISCLAGVTLAVWYPQCWMMSIAGAGMMVGWKFWYIARQPSSGNVARKHFKPHAQMTFCNCFFVGVFGFTLIALAMGVRNEDISLTIYTGVLFLFSMVMIYYRVAVTPQHTDKKAMGRMIGLLDRGRVATKGAGTHARV